MAGTHTVRLTVSGPNGSDTRVIPNLVSVAPGLAISLEITPSQATVAVQESLNSTRWRWTSSGTVWL